jgi:hypothetical protein
MRSNYSTEAEFQEMEEQGMFQFQIIELYNIAKEDMLVSAKVLNTKLSYSFAFWYLSDKIKEYGFNLTTKQERWMLSTLKIIHQEA